MGATYFFLRDPGLLVTAYWSRTEPEETRRVPEARAADPCRPLVRAHLIDSPLLEGTTGTPRDEANSFHSLAFAYVQILK
jgi:hypothetical protein